jgi:hypothetical protein
LCYTYTLKKEKEKSKMKFIKIAATFVLSASVVALVSAPKLPEAQAQLITIEKPMVISVKR